MPIDQIVNIPLRTQPQATFASNADGLWNQLNVFATQANALATDVSARQSDVTTRQSDVATKQTAAANSATAAANSAAQAAGSAATVGVNAWVSGATYSAGNQVYSLINFGTYRRKTGGAGTIDPSLDKTNWVNANANSGFEIGSLASYSTIVTGNTISSPNGGVYLKAGVQVSKAAALAANYDVTQLETMGICSPSSTTLPFAASAIAFGGGLFCIVGSGGLIATSPDGITWTNRTSGTTDNLKVVEYLNGQFVATGTAWLGASTDGISWVAKTAPANTSVKGSLSYINGKYVASSNGGGVYSIQYSTDLITWTGTVGTDAHCPNGVTYFSNKFYYVNGNSFTVAMDLEGTPKIVDSATAVVGYMCAMNGKLFKFPNTGNTGRSSSDGTTWNSFTCSATTIPPSQSSYTGVYGNSIYVATTSTGMQSSPDGATWTPRTTSAAPRGVVFLGGQFLTVGGASTNNIHTSSDGITWTLRTPSVAMKAYAIAYSGSMYVAVGSNTGGTNLNIASSPDGVTWTNRVNSALGSYFMDVTYGAGKFAAISDQVGQIYTSSDGITWASTDISVATSAGFSWKHLRFLNGYFIASTNGGLVFYSADGTTWNAVTMSYPYGTLTQGVPISDYQGGRYFGFGTDGYMSYADTVNAWYIFTTVVQYPASTIRIKSNGTKLMAIGYGSGSGNSHVMVSGDGVCWLSLKKPADLTTDSTIPSDFNYANGSFAFTVANKIVTSANGLTWTSNAMPTTTTAVYGIAYGAGTWWFTGNNGYAYTSTDLATFTLRYGAGTTPLTTTPARSVFGNSVFVGVNIDTGTSAAITPDGVSGNIGMPLSPTNPVGTTFFVKVK